MKINKHKYYFVWFLPLLWSVCSLIQFHFPGDEYGMYFISSIVGSWICLIIQFGDVPKPMLLISVTLTGVIIMAGIGFCMDRIRIRKLVWTGLLFLASIVIFVFMIKSFPSAERALAKNGSWWAYILSAINLGVYMSVIFSFLSVWFSRGYKKLRKAANKSLNQDAQKAHIG